MTSIEDFADDIINYDFNLMSKKYLGISPLI